VLTATDHVGAPEAVGGFEGGGGLSFTSVAVPLGTRAAGFIAAVAVLSVGLAGELSATGLRTFSTAALVAAVAVLSVG